MEGITNGVHHPGGDVPSRETRIGARTRTELVAEMRRLLFTYRPSELQLNRRQRARELMRLNRLADEHDLDEFRDPRNAAHQRLVEIIERLARAPRSNV